MANPKKSKMEAATIDCCLVTIETKTKTFGLDTANEIEVSVQSEEQEAVKLVVKGVLRAQKPKTTTITGNEITLHDNVFNPELALVLQGGTIKFDTAVPTKIVGYTPPVAGSKDKGETFKLCVYSAIYDTAGLITGYEKIEYPNCQGSPIALNTADNSFRAPQYKINSAPKKDEAPYTITYVDNLPTLES
jgi:hypothetical protein